MVINLKNFLSLYSMDLDIQFMYPYTKIAYVFYVVQGHNQDELIVIDDSDLTTLSQEDLTIYKELLGFKERLNAFGFVFKSNTKDVANLDLSSQATREYILVLPKMEPIDYFVSCIPQIIEKQNYKDIIPVWFADSNNYSDFEAKMAIQDAVRKFFPNCQSLIYSNEFVNCYQNSRNITEIINEQDAYYFKVLGKHLVPLDITSLVDNFHNTHIVSNENMCTVFNDFITEVTNKASDNTLIIYQGANFYTYVKLAAHLTYFFKLNCYIPQALYKQFFGILSQMYFNREGLLEDSINYLRNFPTYGFLNTDYTITYIATLQRMLKCKIHLLRIDNILDPHFSEDSLQVFQDFDLTKIKIKPLLDLFDLTNSNFETCKTNEKQLRNLYYAAEKCLNLPRDVMLNVSNTFFCDIGDCLHLAYVTNLEFSTESVWVADALLNSKNINLAVTREPLDLKKAYKVLPLDILQGNAFAKKILMKVEPRLAPISYQEKIGLSNPKQIKEIKPIKTFSEMGILFMYYMINPGRSAINPLPNKYFHEVGLYSTYTLNYRQGVLQFLLNTIKKNTLRDNSFISCYGGFHPMISPRLIIGEDSIR